MSMPSMAGPGARKQPTLEKAAEEADLQWGARFSRASGVENVGTLMKIEHG